MRRLLPFLLLALFAPIVFAAAAGPIINGQGTATLTWTNPTQNVDGTPIAAPGVQGFVLFWGNQSRFGRCLGAPATDPGAVLNSTVADKPAGKLDTSCYPNRLEVTPGSANSKALTLSLNSTQTIYFALAAYTGTGATIADISSYTNQVSKVFTLATTAPPNPPLLNSVNVSINCTTSDPNVTCTFTVQ